MKGRINKYRFVTKIDFDFWKNQCGLKNILEIKKTSCLNIRITFNLKSTDWKVSSYFMHDLTEIY